MKKYLPEIRSLIILATPVIIAQVSQTAMGVVDTIMSGSVSATDMAAVSIGTSIWAPITFFGLGLLMALNTIIAQLNDAGQRNKIAFQIRQGFWVALPLGIFLMTILYNSHYIIYGMSGIDPKLAETSVNFLRYIMWGVPGYLCFQILRNQCDGISETKPGMIISFVGFLVNIPVNYIFIYGKLGMPALGGAGSGVTTAVVYWVMVLAMYWYIKNANFHQDLKLKKAFTPPDWQTIKRLVGLGLPTGLAMFFEVTLFAIAALLIAPLGIVAVASHQVALSVSTLIFVVPMSLAIAATIQVSNRLGQGSVNNANMVARISIMVAFVFSVFTAVSTVLFRENIAQLYTVDPEVIALASSLLLLSAFYQLSDALQTAGIGVLRGYKDTRPIFYITITSYWLIGLSVGYLLALTDYLVPAMGPVGIWIGFLAGLTGAAILVIWRIYWLQKQPAAVTLHRSAH